MEAKTGYLYLASTADHIKIGFSLNPERRVLSLRAKGPKSIYRKGLKLEGHIAGSRKQESWFHREYRDELIQGTTEWYPAGGRAHSTFRDYLEKGKAPEVPPKPLKTPKYMDRLEKEFGVNPLVDPLEWAIGILENRKIDLTIQRYRSSLTPEEVEAWYMLGRASEYLCQQL